MAERRLEAIMFIDLAGFTQLSQSNEEKALAILEEYRGIVRPAVSSHNGREVKTIGDGFLIEFGSALDGVRCAYAIQVSLHERNHSRSEPEHIRARIGIHVGDVVRSGEDIHGDAVNIASRIEPLAEAGGICVSQPVHFQVANKFEAPMVSIGQRTLKNVFQPMEVFKIVLPWTNDQTQGEQSPKTRVAILPFSNISPDKNDEYFADGMTEELINTISHNRQLKVIARTTVGRYKDTPKSVREIGREIGAGTILEGSVRKAGDKIRVTAQLIDAATEDHLWSDNYDRRLDDVFSIQSEIAKSVSEALMAKLLPEEQASVVRKATLNPSAYVKYLRGRTLLSARTEEGMKEALKLFKEATAEDGNYAEAYAGLADAYFLLANYEHMSTTEALTKGREALNRSLQLNDELAEAHNTLANYLTADFKFEEAEREFKKAISINPNYSLAHHWYAICLMEMGDLHKGNAETRVALELDPLSTALASNLAYGYSLVGDQNAADEYLRRMEGLDPPRIFSDYITALVCEARGDIKSSVSLMKRAVEKQPNRASLLPLLGYYLALSGDRQGALEVIDRIKAQDDEKSAKWF
ncbi:MAG TPA: adenylate/guanylate cyclase domain-containing protein, partial [Nitrososphaerales archaeon]|nr:adenylate/guanylate cyclase domain-containing protein [Nitrososphaerales archaeon]